MKKVSKFIIVTFYILTVFFPTLLVPEVHSQNVEPPTASIYPLSFDEDSTDEAR